MNHKDLTWAQDIAQLVEYLLFTCETVSLLASIEKHQTS